jgi:uncharacterized protein
MGITKFSRILLVPLLSAVVMLMTTACSVLQSYPDRVSYPLAAFADGDYAEAIRAIQAMTPPDRDRILYLMESGTFRHTQGDLSSSNSDFLLAAAIMKEFDERAVISLRDAAAFAGALGVNDNMRPYRGPAHERILIHTYLAMNFLLMHDPEGLGIEIRRAYARQKEAREENKARIARTEEKAEKKDLDTDSVANAVGDSYDDQRAILKRAGSVYQNAFTYYLSAIGYELAGKIDDAYIDVKTVHRLNPAFRPARRDLLRYSRMLGLDSDYERWRKRFGRKLADSLPRGHGEVILLFQCGQAPVRKQIKLAVPVPGKDGFNMVTVAIPKYEMRRNPVTRAVIYANGVRLAQTQPIMDVEATAVRDLWDQAPGIATRQLIRAGSRYVMIEATRQTSPILALLLSLLGYAVEQADLRSWNSLPKDFQIARESLPAGKYNLEMELVGSGKRVKLANVPVRRGGMTILVLRSTRNHGTAKFVVY